MNKSINIGEIPSTYFGKGGESSELISFFAETDKIAAESANKIIKETFKGGSTCRVSGKIYRQIGEKIEEHIRDQN